MFNAALEQSEQLFTAAADAGYATRPLLAFYGLSQAGRAIAAAAVRAGDLDWKLSGHGIQVTNMANDIPCASLQLKCTRGGSFVSVARFLSSSWLTTETPLGFLWRCVPELQDASLGDDSEHPNVLKLTKVINAEETMLARIQDLPERFLDPETPDGVVSDFLARYPGLAGNQARTGGEAHASRMHPTGVAILREWTKDAGFDPNQFDKERTQPYRHDGDRWVFPAAPGADRPLHPLMVWWGILFALSMLARYQPASWVGYLDVNSQQAAVPLETALNAALEICPELILRAIEQVST